MGIDRIVVDVVSRSGHDEGDHRLQAVRVAGADHRRLEHVGVLDQHASTSAGDTQMPPALIMSLLRPRNV